MTCSQSWENIKVSTAVTLPFHECSDCEIHESITITLYIELHFRNLVFHDISQIAQINSST